MRLQIPVKPALWVTAMLVVLACGPLFLDSYISRVVTMAFMFAALAQAWNLLGGFAGYASFGNAVFYGVGAYTTALLMSKAQWPFVPAVVAAALVAALLALIIGPVLRLHGHYFAIGTMAVAELVSELVRNSDFTGAANGLQTPIVAGGIDALSRYFYLAMLTMLAITVAVAAAVRFSRIGYALMAIRADENTATSLGVETTRYKLVALVLSGLLTGAVGGVYAYWITFIDPSSVFRVQVSLTMILMAIFGGAGTILGPLVGAAVLSVIQELAWDRFPTVYTAVLGLVMVVLVIFMPRGLSELATNRQRFRSWDAFLTHVRKYSI